MKGDHAELWRIADATAWATNGTGIVALDLGSPTAHPLTLQGTAAYVWDEIAASGPLSAAALITNVADAYEVDPKVVHDDIMRLLERLHDQNLVLGPTGLADT